MAHSLYQEAIREDMAALGFIGRHDPATIEAWMRLEHGTLDGLSPSRFRAEVATSIECADASTPAENTSLCESYGLQVAP